MHSIAEPTCLLPERKPRIGGGGGGGWRAGEEHAIAIDSPFGDDASAGGAQAPLFFPARRRATAGGGDWRREDHLDTAGPFLQ